MKQDQETIYEEPEVLDTGFRKKAEHAAVEFDHASVEDLRKKLFWAGFGGLFVFLFLAFLVIGIIVTILFWLLPFAIAAGLVALVIVACMWTFNSIKSLFGK